MRFAKCLCFSGALLAPLTAHAQTAPSPAQMGITAGTPQQLEVLDSAKTWAPIGTVSGGSFTRIVPAVPSNATGIIADGYWGWAEATYTNGGTSLTAHRQAMCGH